MSRTTPAVAAAPRRALRPVLEIAGPQGKLRPWIEWLRPPPPLHLPRKAAGATMFQGVGVGDHGLPRASTRLAASMSFRMTATVTSFLGLPAVVSRSAKALKPGSKRLAATAAR